jgi:LytS/YehU family sensor histidine kinase
VHDDGCGLGGPPRKGAGLALANARERLAARFGDQARLELADAAPGVCASLAIPLHSLPTGR